MADLRHTLHLDDRGITLIERALRAYHIVIGIQAAADLRTEADHIAHVAAVVQLHLHCDCTPSVPPATKPGRKSIEDRKVV